MPTDFEQHSAVPWVAVPHLRKTSSAIKSLRQRIAAGLPEGAKLTLTPANIRRLVKEHNERCARTGAGIAIPTWLVKQRNGVAAVQA